MSTFRILIDTDNAAFTGNLGYELARILREAANRLELFGVDADIESGIRLTDLNGNTVGRAQMIAAAS